MRKNKRWYDKDSTVSLAISVLRDSNIKNQSKAALFLEEQGKLNKIKVKDFDLKEVFNFKKRWYDSNEPLKNSLEYLRYAEPKIQKKMALALIEFLYHQEKSVNA